MCCRRQLVSSFSQYEWRSARLPVVLLLLLLAYLKPFGTALLRREPRLVRSALADLEDSAAMEARLVPTQFGTSYEDDGYFQPWKYNPFHAATNRTGKAGVMGTTVFQKQESLLFVPILHVTVEAEQEVLEATEPGSESSSRRLTSYYTNSASCGVYPNTVSDHRQCLPKEGSEGSELSLTCLCLLVDRTPAASVAYSWTNARPSTTR